jgi:GT2 family glycosyltransferase
MTSIVVPTRDRKDSLLRLLRSLVHPADVPLIAEVLVVDDASTDGTAAAVDAFRAPWPLRRLRTDGHGPAIARNRGAEAATGDIVLFLDDDLEVSPGLVAAHVAAHAEAPDDIAVVGPYPPRHEPSRSPFVILARNWWEDHFREVEDPGHRVRSTDLLSGNLSMRTATFLRFGGFDEEFRGCRAEDWELGVRLLAAGLRIVPCAAAHALHHEIDTTWPDRALSDARREGRGVALMDRRHPELAAARERGPLLDGRMKRAIRRTAADHPLIGDAAWKGIRLFLPVFAVLRARRAWRHAWGLLHLYRFWRAYHEVPAAPDRATLDDAARHDSAREGATARADPTPLTVDLARGLDSAERLLDDERPHALRLIWEDRRIGDVDVEPGTEPWRGAHLRKLLAERFAAELARELGS